MDDIFAKYLKRMDQEIMMIHDYVMNGRCSDYPEYLAKLSEKRAYVRARDNFTRSIQDYADEETKEDESS